MEEIYITLSVLISKDSSLELKREIKRQSCVMSFVATEHVKMLEMTEI